MESAVAVIYHTSSYQCRVDVSEQKRLQLAIETVQLVQDDQLTIQTESVLFRIQTSMRLELRFLGTLLQPLSTQRLDCGAMRCMVPLDQVIHILIQSCPATFLSSTSNVKSVSKEGQQAARQVVRLFRGVERAEARRRATEKRMTDLQLQKEKEIRRLSTQKKRATTRREELLPQLVDQLPILFDALLPHASEPVQRHLLLIHSMLSLYLVPLNSKTVISRYGEWIRQTRQAVLSLSDRSQREHLEVHTPDKLVYADLEVYTFAINWPEMAAGSKNYFVTLLPNETEPVVGVFQVHVVVGKQRSFYGAVIRTEGIVTDWLPVLAKTLTIQPTRISEIQTALVTGTAYVLAQELLQR